jgi:citrate synthase
VSLKIMDKQIYRLIGKATTLAASVSSSLRSFSNSDTPTPEWLIVFVKVENSLCHPRDYPTLARMSLPCVVCCFILTQCSFLYQLDHLGEEQYTPNPVLEKALDVLFLLHADHELNASSTTVLQTASSLVDPYSAIAAGCASL